MRATRLRRALRVVGRAVLALLIAAMIASLLFHGWLEAQGRALIVLTRTSNTPVLGWAVGVLTDDPGRGVRGLRSSSSTGSRAADVSTRPCSDSRVRSRAPVTSSRFRIRPDCAAAS